MTYALYRPYDIFSAVSLDNNNNNDNGMYVVRTEKKGEI